MSMCACESTSLTKKSTLDRIRTCDRRIRNPLLYPTELRGQMPEKHRFSGAPACDRVSPTGAGCPSGCPKRSPAEIQTKSCLLFTLKKSTRAYRNRPYPERVPSERFEPTVRRTGFSKPWLMPGSESPAKAWPCLQPGSTCSQSRPSSRNYPARLAPGFKRLREAGPRQPCYHPAACSQRIRSNSATVRRSRTIDVWVAGTSCSLSTPRIRALSTRTIPSVHPSNTRCRPVPMIEW